MSFCRVHDGETGTQYNFCRTKCDVKVSCWGQDERQEVLRDLEKEHSLLIRAALLRCVCSKGAVEPHMHLKLVS